MTEQTIILGVVLAATIAVLAAAHRFLRPFFQRIAFCLIPLVLAGYVAARGNFKYGVDLVGGTILVYELDLSKFPDQKLPENYNKQDLVAALKRRIDPNDLYNVTIRPVGDTRVEIILPGGSQHQAKEEQRKWKELLEKVQGEWPQAKNLDNISAGDKQTLISRLQEQFPEAAPQAPREKVEQLLAQYYPESKERKAFTPENVQETKDLITRVGSLEFRILANMHDDGEAIAAAQKYLADPKNKEELKKAAIDHKAPPKPLSDKGDTFPVTLNKGEPFPYSYSWIELGPVEREHLGLNNEAENDPKHADYWKKAAEARVKGEAILMPLGKASFGLLYSRDVQNVVALPPKERGKKYEYFVLTRDSEKGKEVTGQHLTNAGGRIGDEGWEVTFSFNQRGSNLFGDLTGNNAPPKGEEHEEGFRRQLAIVLDNQIQSAPNINSRITSDGRITGKYTQEDVERTVRVLRAGQLPASLKQQPVSENTMGATLGADTIRKGMIAVLGAFAAVLLFMMVYYRFAGLVASVALLANLLLTVGFMVLVNATFTLPGLAGLVLMLGMAVDANVLIYERLREERDRGATLSLALRNGYDRAFPTIIDTHLSSIFTALVLYTFGNDQLKGFAISLTVGLIISLFTSLYMTRLLFDIWQAKNWLRKLSMYRFFSRPNIDFMRIRYYWFTATIILTIFGAAVFIGRLPNDLNIDFNGGTAITVRTAQPMDIGDFRNQLGENNQKTMLQVARVKEVPVPETADEKEKSRTFEIFYRNPDGSEKPRTIQLKDPPEGQTAAEREAVVKQRAEQLPDLSVEQIFEGYAAGGQSNLFTVRTSERADELVQALVSRLLGDQLKKIDMTFVVAQKGREAKLTFLDPVDKKAEVFASPGQVRLLLDRELKKKKIDTAFILDTSASGKSEEGRFQEMVLRMNEPGVTPPEELERVLEATKQEFAERPQPERLEVFDSHLARDTQLRAMYAILASWGAILLYLWFRFGNWTFGLAAVLCLIHDLFFTLGIIAFCHYLDISVPWLARILLIQDFKIDLPAVAALLTLVGYSVNDTIVVFDRIREVRGKNPDLTPQMINDSVNQTLSRTLLASLTTWLVVFVLYVAGGDGIHLFAFVMVVGVIVGTYSSIYIASPLLLMFGEGKKSGAQRERLPQPAEV